VVSSSSVENIAGYINAPDGCAGRRLPRLQIAGADFRTTEVNFASSTSPFVATSAMARSTPHDPGLQSAGGCDGAVSGTVDGEGWYNNSGEITVTVNGVGSSRPATGAPEPATWPLLLVRFAGLVRSTRSQRVRSGAST
jgi:hypothetical protein